MPNKFSIETQDIKSLSPQEKCEFFSALFKKMKPHAKSVIGHFHGSDGRYKCELVIETE